LLKFEDANSVDNHIYITRRDDNMMQSDNSVVARPSPKDDGLASFRLQSMDKLAEYHVSINQLVEARLEG
jgi:hypothetical protein